VDPRARHAQEGIEDVSREAQLGTKGQPSLGVPVARVMNVQADRSSDSVTVVIPVWDNYVHYLPEAVESVGNDPGVSILIVDNASRTPIPETPGASIFRSQSRLNVGGIRNLGLSRVTTEYALVLDADDALLPGTLEFLRSRLAANPSLSVCAVSILDGETGERHRTPRRFVPAFSRWRRAFALADCVWSLYPIQSCAMMRTSQAREAGGYADASWGDDWVLAVSLAFRGRVEVHDRLGRFYRANPDSIWRQPRRSRDLVASARLVRRRIRDDPAIPQWTRAILPAVAALQLFAIYALRPLYLAATRMAGEHSMSKTRGPHDRTPDRVLDR